MDTRSRKINRWMPLALVLLLLILVFFVNKFSGDEQPREKEISEKTIKGLNRNPEKIEYSKHARCRMECRYIDENEVKNILKEGKINYAKSDIGKNPECKRKYAVEGLTKDGQRVRIIFAPCKNELTVVTVIDLGVDWPCNCP